jgi:hypothetical protein
MDLDEELRDIEMIRTTVAGLSRTRDAVYVALTQIYVVALKWAKSGHARELRDAVIEYEKLEIEGRVKRSLVRFLIEVGWRGLNKKLRPRYANALRYALSQSCPADKLTTCLKRGGGIEGCEKTYLAQRKSVRSKRTAAD